MHPHRTTNKTCYTATRGEFEDMLNKWIADKDLLSSGLAYEICKVPATATMACPQVKHPRKAIRLHIIKVMGCTQADWRVYDRCTCQFMNSSPLFCLCAVAHVCTLSFEVGGVYLAFVCCESVELCLYFCSMALTSPCATFLLQSARFTCHCWSLSDQLRL